ncbi:beta-galactosidase [Cellulomonas hominis]
MTVSGEVHYFRLDRRDWADRLDAAVDAGLTAVATYVPWLVHELPDGTVDLDGRSRPELDLGAFLGLCAERGLPVIARPGPFVMAELKHEGLPSRLLRDHPGIVPPGWDGRTPAETIVDYLHPDYLAACRGWYEAVIPVLAAHSTGRGGPVAAVQLDNEIGMLPWVANSPDLSERTLRDLVLSAVARDGYEAVRQRYGLDPDVLADPAAPRGAVDAWVRALRSPEERHVLALRRDLGRHARERYATYVATLAGWVRELGLPDVPLLVNVHGCWGESATMFPLGVSQLSRTWQGRPDIVPGTDYYIGDLTLAKLPGLWASNAFLAATVGPDQPTACLEFEVGTGDYGEALDVSVGPEAAPLKLQLCLAQGNALVNYYLFTGGRNAPLAEPAGDGNDRIASTGERHGFAAPVGPEGQRSPGYPALRRATTAVTGAARLLGAARPEPAPISLGFVPDHYLTEYHYPGSALDRRLVDELTRFRGSGPREVMTRALVLAGYAPDAVDLQAGPLDVGTTPALTLSTTPYLDADVQQRVVDWLHAGGRLLLQGPLPEQDLLGRPATVLVDALGLGLGARREGSASHFPSVTPEPGLPMAEVRAGFVQPLATAGDAQVLARVTGTGEPCVVQVPVGRGAAVVVAADLPCLLPVWRRLLDGLGVAPLVELTTDQPGVVAVPTATADGARVVHLVNVAPWDVVVQVHRDGSALLDRPLELPGRSGVWLVQPPGSSRAIVAGPTRTGE